MRLRRRRRNKYPAIESLVLHFDYSGVAHKRIVESIDEAKEEVEEMRWFPLIGCYNNFVLYKNGKPFMSCDDWDGKEWMLCTEKERT